MNLPAGYILFGAKWSICETVDLTESEKKFMNNEVKVKVKQSLTSQKWHRWFQKVKVPRFHDNGTGWG